MALMEDGFGAHQLEDQESDGEKVCLTANGNHMREREAATREILEVISQSRDDEQPVFDAILKRAATLCRAPQAGLLMPNDARTHIRYIAGWGPPSKHFQVGISEWSIDDPIAVTTAIRESRIVNIADLLTDALTDEEHPSRLEIIEKEGIRSVLAVPLISDGKAIGCFDVYRLEVDPFTDDEVTLIQNFAAQAVIAIEKVRQFRQLQTKLEREAATREILQVISQSRDDEAPVFDAILENACKLCDAPLAYLSMTTEDRTHVISPARRGTFAKFGTTLDNLRVPLAESRLALARAIAECRVFREDDISDHDLYTSGDPNRVSMVEDEGARSLMVVPLISRSHGIGSITLYRRKVAPFQDDDVTLVESFAAQAVIAIENVRQFREVQIRLAREAATREILEVISLNPDNEQPIFDAITKSATELCNAPYGGLFLRNSEDTDLVIVAANTENSGYVKMLRENPHSLSDDKSLTVEAVKSMQVQQYRDIEELRDDQSPSDQLRATWQLERMRTLLYVPLIKGDRAIGVLALYRLEVLEFSDHDIELLKIFAAQAVIAIENVRQFKALESLNAELGDRVEEQVGEIERMGRLKRFLPAAVADTVVSQGSDKMLSSHRALLGVLFCDIRGFTAFCETAEPEETIEVLQTYHEEMGKLINDHGAGVDHRMGDGIMVLFNDPLPCDDPAGDAVRLATAMRVRMADLCGQWKRLGHRLGFGVGVSLGYATVGMVGFEGRFDYTASGTAINLASRLCDEAEDGEILLSPRAAIAVEDDFQVEFRGEISLKGIREAMEVFKVTGVDAT